jgi:site-specific DNA-methyltransferase (adenine-specific)
MNKIFNDDAISIMDRMIAKEYKVGLLITDPPYKITARGNGGNSGGMFQKKEVNNGKIFKTNDLEIEDWLPRFYNILKDNSHCYIMTNNKNITNYLKAINEMYFNDDKKQKFHFIKNLIWVKDNKIMGQTYMSQFEYIIMLRKGEHKKINDCGTSDVLQFPNKKMKGEDGKTIHDTEKPIELMRVLIENSSNENDIIFEPFMGIGSTCIASLLSNRQYIGVELDENYFKISEERIKKALEEKRKEKDFNLTTSFGDGM